MFTLTSEHPITCTRNGFVCHVTNGVKSFDVNAESAPEARRFERAFNWLAHVHPEWTLDEVIAHTMMEHAAAVNAQRRRRFRTSFCGPPRSHRARAA